MRSPTRKRARPAAACPASTLDAAPYWRTWSSPYLKQRVFAWFPTASNLTVIGPRMPVPEIRLGQSDRNQRLTDVDADRVEAVGPVRKGAGRSGCLPVACAVEGAHRHLIMASRKGCVEVPETPGVR